MGEDLAVNELVLPAEGLGTSSGLGTVDVTVVVIRGEGEEDKGAPDDDIEVLEEGRDEDGDKEGVVNADVLMVESTLR